MDIIRIENITKCFGDNIILKDLSVSFQKGSVTSIIGPSGSGKSTLLRCINQLEELSDGKILFNDEDITKRDVNINVARSKIGMVFQNFNLFNNLTVLDNCIIGPMRVLHETKTSAINKALKLLKDVGMLEFRDRNVNTLSGGQKQRVAIARTLAMEPEVILFDEPTSSLDPEMVGEVLEVIKSIVTSDISFIVVTHEMEFAKEVSNRVIFMADGLIVADGTPAHIFSSPSNDRLKTFIKRFV